MAFSGDGQSLAVATSDGPIHVYDTTTWDEKATLQRVRLQDKTFLHYNNVALNADGTILAAVPQGQGTPQCETWSVGTQSTRTMAVGQCGALALSPDGKTVAIAVSNAGIRFADAATGQEKRP